MGGRLGIGNQKETSDRSADFKKKRAASLGGPHVKGRAEAVLVAVFRARARAHRAPEGATVFCRKLPTAPYNRKPKPRPFKGTMPHPPLFRQCLAVIGQVAPLLQ
jgi:hypothetical protein